MRSYFYGVKVQLLITKDSIPVEFGFVPGSEHNALVLNYCRYNSIKMKKFLKNKIKMKFFIKKTLLNLMVAMIIFSGCSNNKTGSTSSNDFLNTSLLDSSKFDTTINGKAVKLYTLRNKNNMKAVFTNLGGRIISLIVPDSTGKLTDVVVGLGSAIAYQESTEPYFGATIGRYANRIAKGKFKIDEKSYKSSLNNGANMLHGGTNGFQHQVWETVQPDNQTIILNYLSKDGEEGFPGNLKVEVTYTLTDDNELKIEYFATTDEKTVVSLTNHAFFNLNGEGSGTILNHTLQIFAKEYNPVDSTLIPIGIEDVKGTPFDFSQPTKIGARIQQDNQQLKNGNGYDHNFILDGTKAMGMNHAATVKGDRSGIVMDIYTQEPGLQFYTGNFMESKNILKGGAKDDFRTAFCLETQHYPDSPNHPNFPSTVLKPYDTYKTTSIYKFAVK